MIVAILVAVGVPLWICAVGIVTLLVRNRALRNRPGNVPVRVLRAGKKRWSKGHGVWVHDIFAFRGMPAVWIEVLAWATDASTRAATEQERKKLRRLGDEPVIVTLMLDDGDPIDVAARKEHNAELLGPFAASTEMALASSGNTP